MKTKPETALSKSIQDALEAIGVWVLRINSGGRVRRVRLAPAGTPDLYCIALNVWLEVKRPGEKPSHAQLAWYARAQHDGVKFYVVRSVDEAIKYVTAERDARRYEKSMGWQ